ncbi:MAG: PpiC-type peptidyl-prolyl cis-trans isomerase [Armatimonadetes bacterium]|nr:PpiC-type peptidyl-prolyl cis-trans isomerase [Armatimonadota bacterium]
MRRSVFSLFLAGVALTGCSSFRDLFSAHADVAAEAGAVQLPAQRLADMVAGVTKGQRQRVTRETADFITDTWVDYALFSQAVALNRLPVDSASVAEAVWPELAELKGTHFHDTLMSRRAAASDTAADSLYNSDVRVLQHILFGARNAPPPVKDATRKKAEATLARVRKGADFSRLASELSEDPGSKADSGYLPPGPKGRFVASFDSAAWALQPGQTSGVVETPFGFHLIRRPSLGEVRGRLDDYLLERAGAALDSTYMDSLAQASNIEIKGDAAASIRAALGATEESRRSERAITTYKGGELTVQEFLRWVRALPPQYLQQLKAADDSTLRRFARVLTQNTLLLRQADAAGIRPTELEWKTMERKYLSQLDTLKNEMGLAGGDVTDSSVSAAERQKVAGLKMEQYFDNLIAGKATLRPLPSALASLLRERLPFRIDQAGVERAVEIAKEMKAKADSAGGGSPVQRAPGGPPLPAPGAAPQGPGQAGSAPPPPTGGAVAPGGVDSAAGKK